MQQDTFLSDKFCFSTHENKLVYLLLFRYGFFFFSCHGKDHNLVYSIQDSDKRQKTVKWSLLNLCILMLLPQMTPFLTPYLPPLFLSTFFSVLQVCLPRWDGHCDCQGQLRDDLPLLRYVHPGHPGTINPTPQHTHTLVLFLCNPVHLLFLCRSHLMLHVSHFIFSFCLSFFSVPCL